VELCTFKTCLNRKANFTEMSLGVNFAVELSQILLFNDNIAHLNLQKNNLGDIGVRSIMKTLRKSKNVVKVNFASNELNNEGMVCIFENLTYNESVTHLNVSTLDGVARNKMSILATDSIKDLLRKNKFLAILDISSTGIGNAGFQIICDVLSDGEGIKTLESLKAANNDLNSMYICEHIK